MAKDPAFLFYSSDFLTGTLLMSDQEVGQYIRLLCWQHQNGHFDGLAMQRLCGGNPTASVLSKFKTDESGLFFNERLDIEVVKRKQHSEKQKENARKRWHSDGNATAMPLENENVNENRNGIEKEKGVQGEKQKTKLTPPESWPLDDFNTLWADFREMRRKKKQPMTANAEARRLARLVEVSGGIWTEAKQVMIKATDNAWLDFYPLKDGQSNGAKEQYGKTIIYDKA